MVPPPLFLQVVFEQIRLCSQILGRVRIGGPGQLPQPVDDRADFPAAGRVCKEVAGFLVQPQATFVDVARFGPWGCHSRLSCQPRPRLPFAWLPAPQPAEAPPASVPAVTGTCGFLRDR
jgi:hypothetical protein